MLLNIDAASYKTLSSPSFPRPFLPLFTPPSPPYFHLSSPPFVPALYRLYPHNINPHSNPSHHALIRLLFPCLPFPLNPSRLIWILTSPPFWSHLWHQPFHHHPLIHHKLSYYPPEWDLDGIKWALLVQWPAGIVARGGGQRKKMTVYITKICRGSLII